MKKYLILLFLLIFTISMLFLGVSCKEEAAPAEEAEEEAAPAEEAEEEAAPAEKVTIIYWFYGGSTESIEWNKNKVQEFNEMNPNIQVNLEEQVWATILEHFVAAAEAGTLADVSRISPPQMIGKALDGGYIEPLDNFADFAEVKEWFVEGYLNSYKIGGKYWVMPNLPLPFILVGNKDMFEEAGIAELPKTWDELREVARQLTKDTDNDGKIDQWGYGLMGEELAGNAVRWTPYVFKAGGGLLSEENPTDSLFNTEPWKVALQLFVDMNLDDGSIEPGFMANNFPEYVTKFVDDKFAMGIEGPWMNGVVKEIDPDQDILIGRVPEPDEVVGTFPPATFLDAAGYVISSTSENKEAAWEFLKFITGPEADKDYVLIPELGGLPVTKASQGLPEWQDYPGYEAFDYEGAHGARPYPQISPLLEIYTDVMSFYFLSAINGDISVEEALDGMKTKCDAILARGE